MKYGPRPQRLPAWRAASLNSAYRPNRFLTMNHDPFISLFAFEL